MKSISSLIVEMYNEVMYQIENNLFEERLNSKESFRKAIALWKNLPEGKKESEAKRILKASKREGYIVKQKEILKYADKIEDYGKMKAKKSVRKEIRSKKKAKREEKFSKVLSNVKDEDLENKTRIELLALAIKRGGRVKELTKMNREELLNLFPETAEKKKEDKNKGDDVDFNFVTKKDKSKIKEQDYDKTFTRIRKEDIEKFKTALDFTSKDELRMALTGVYIGSEGKIVATDSLKMVFDDIGLKLDEPVILSGDYLKLALKNVKDTKDIEVKKIVKVNPKVEELKQKAIDTHNKRYGDYADKSSNKKYLEDELKEIETPQTFYQINGVNVPVFERVKFPAWQTIIPTKFEDTGKVTKSEIDNVIKKAEDEALKAVKKQIISKEDIRYIDDGLFQKVLGASLTVKQRQSINSLSDERFEEELDKIIKKQISKTYKESGMIIFNGDTITINTRSGNDQLLGGFEFKTPLKNKIKYLKNEDLKLGFHLKRFKEVIDSLGEENLDLSILSPSRPVVINNKAILMPIKV